MFQAILNHLHNFEFGNFVGQFLKLQENTFPMINRGRAIYSATEGRWIILGFGRL